MICHLTTVKKTGQGWQYSIYCRKIGCLSEAQHPCTANSAGILICQWGCNLQSLGDRVCLCCKPTTKYITANHRINGAAGWQL